MFYLIYNAVSYTIVMLSYNTMNALITKIDSERVTMNVVSYTVVLFANILINSLTLGTVEALGNTVSAWRIVMTIFTTAGTILILLSGLTVKELPQDNETAPSTTTLPKNSLANDLQNVFKNPYFIWAILYAVVVNFVLASNLSLSLYYCEINLGDINIYSSLSVVVLLACLPGLFMAPRIVAKLGTFKCNVFVSLFIVVLILLSLPFAFMDTVNRPLFYVTFCMRFLPFGVLCASIAPIVPSLVRYSYLQTGRHLEGLLYSSSSIGGKISSGIAAAMPGWILSGIGYTADATTQSGTTMARMNFWFYALPIISGLLIVFIFSRLNVEKGIRELETQH